MPDTRTVRLEAIARYELEEPGDYTSAASVRAVAAALAALKAQNEELEKALAGLVAEMAGLPHSLGYEFTHLPAARAALAKVQP